MRIAQILDGKAHWIFEADVMPEFSQDIILMDISFLPDVVEGWTYNAAANTFAAPIVPAVPIVETIDQKILRLEAQNLILMDAIATMFEEILVSRGGDA